MNNSSANLKRAIQAEISRLMDGVIDNAVRKNPFDPEKHQRAKPLYAALVPDEIFMGSHFGRRFVTPFGKIWQSLAAIIRIGAESARNLHVPTAQLTLTQN